MHVRLLSISMRNLNCRFHWLLVKHIGIPLWKYTSWEDLSNKTRTFQTSHTFKHIRNSFLMQLILSWRMCWEECRFCLLFCVRHFVKHSFEIIYTYYGQGQLRNVICPKIMHFRDEMIIPFYDFMRVSILKRQNFSFVNIQIKILAEN